MTRPPARARTRLLNNDGGWADTPPRDLQLLKDIVPVGLELSYPFLQGGDHRPIIANPCRVELVLQGGEGRGSLLVVGFVDVVLEGFEPPLSQRIVRYPDQNPLR